MMMLLLLLMMMMTVRIKASKKSEMKMTFQNKKG
jgi:hypothetical protein